MGVDAHFAFETMERDGIPVVHASGEIDVVASPELDMALSTLIDQGASVAIVDFSDVTFIDSTCLNTLVIGLKRCDAAGSALRLVVSNPTIEKVFKITSLDSAFSIFDTLDSAVAGRG
jgi:anti-sigma B factor antagonist